MSITGNIVELMDLQLNIRMELRNGGLIVFDKIIIDFLYSVINNIMESLPLEILDIIARVGGYRGLLGLRLFADSLNISRRVDFMVELEYNVDITWNRITWKYNDHTHRIDGPAVIWHDGTKEWHINGKYHRIDGPTIEYSNGNREWFVYGFLHRIDGTAIDCLGGTKQWYVNELRHRHNRPVVEYFNGDKYWYLNGKHHRIGDPVIETIHGDKFWYVDGKRHRIDKSSSIYSGDCRQE